MTAPGRGTRMTPEPDGCRAYEVDGRPVVVRGGPPLDAEGQAALAEVVRAAEAKYRAEHPDEAPGDLGARQEAAMERLRQRSPALRRLHADRAVGSSDG